MIRPKKQRRFDIRIDEASLTWLAARASAAGLSLAEYIREAALARALRDQSSDPSGIAPPRVSSQARNA